MKILKRILLVLAILVAAFLIIPFFIPLPDNGVTPQSLAGTDDHFIAVQGVLTHYIERGDPNDPPVLLLHGFGGGTFNWRLNIDAIAEAGYYVVAFDRPPFGLTEKPYDFDYSAPNLAKFTADFMDALNISSAVLVGHSAGGTVIAHMALLYPERIEKMVFAAGAVGMSGGPSLVGPLLSFPPITRWARIAARSLVTPDFFANSLRSAYHNPDAITPDLQALYAQPAQISGWDAGFIGLMRDAGQNGVDMTALSQVQIPALLLWGDADTWVELSVGQRLLQTLPNAQLITYPDVGHILMEENAAQFNDDLIAFLGTSN